jgi:ribonuclease HII
MIVGIDEVGRGCLAGPLVAGAVVLEKPLRGLRDSKKLSRLQRETLDLKIRAKALAIGIGWVPPRELDVVGLTQAVRLAMERAIAAVTVPYERIIIDGNYNFLAGFPQSETLVRADDVVPAVSAASIVAKVARDHFMYEAAAQYPGYGFDSHVGYGTVGHITALQNLGICELHRRSFRPVQQYMDIMPRA